MGILAPRPEDDRQLSTKPHHCKICARPTQARHYIPSGKTKSAAVFLCGKCDLEGARLQPKFDNPT